jgi:hypothetical protein
MIERDLVAIGFQPRGDGTLHSPGRIALASAGADFFRVTLELPGGDVLSCHISKLALKISKGEKTCK